MKVDCVDGKTTIPKGETVTFIKYHTSFIIKNNKHETLHVVVVENNEGNKYNVDRNKWANTKIFETLGGNEYKPVYINKYDPRDIRDTVPNEPPKQHMDLIKQWGWNEYYSKQHKRNYYFNSGMNKSIWTVPRTRTGRRRLSAY